MHRYFFHLFDDTEVPDLEGRDLSGEHEARFVAISECREIIAAVKAGRINLGHRIDVEDVYRRPLFTVRFEDAVKVVA